MEEFEWLSLGVGRTIYSNHGRIPRLIIGISERISIRKSAKRFREITMKNKNGSTAKYRLLDCRRFSLKYNPIPLNYAKDA